jgi:hypothetical protein
LFDPVTANFTPTGSMNIGRVDHQALCLKNGKVLVVAGFGTNTSLLNSAELFDPIAETWTLTASLPVGLTSHTVTLLPDGRVLVAGGFATNVSGGAFVFDPENGTNGTWTTVGSLNIARWRHSALLLPNGKVLVVGGEDTDFSPVADAEIFDPAVGQWTPTGSLSTGIYEANLTLLPNGKVLAAAGFITRTAEIYDVGLGFAPSSQPQISTATALSLGGNLSLTGFRFRGVSESSGGNGSQNSSSDCPVVQLRSIENGQVTFLSSTNWSVNTFDSLPIENFQMGYALATVFVNGIPSPSRIISVSAGSQVVLRNPAKLSNGALLFDFTGTPGASFTVVAATNISLPPNSWTTIGTATEISPGQFQFTDLAATNQVQRFYRVSSAK